jgi:predicted RNA-binding protein with PIN domain
MKEEQCHATPGRAAMSAAYLIDGYNMIHAVGILQGKAGPHGLEKARKHLLGLLSSLHAADAGTVTVVFDAGAVRPGGENEQVFRGLHIRFAAGFEEADDLIELLIHEHSAPRRLHVVSDDHRLQRAARRRHCQVLSCSSYLDQLHRARRRRKITPSDKEGRPAAAETAHWLAEFADLADDPELEELFNPFGFDEQAP